MGDILNITNPHYFIRRLWKCLKIITNTKGYKINLYKSTVFPHTNNKCTEKETMGSFQFTIATNKIKHQGIDPIKMGEAIYNEKFTPL